VVVVGDLNRVVGVVGTVGLALGSRGGEVTIGES
jgi:hypothetical protein